MGRGKTLKLICRILTLSTIASGNHPDFHRNLIWKAKSQLDTVSWKCDSWFWENWGISTVNLLKCVLNSSRTMIREVCKCLIGLHCSTFCLRSRRDLGINGMPWQVDYSPFSKQLESSIFFSVEAVTCNNSPKVGSWVTTLCLCTWNVVLSLFEGWANFCFKKSQSNIYVFKEHIQPLHWQWTSWLTEK